MSSSTYNVVPKKRSFRAGRIILLLLLVILLLATGAWIYWNLNKKKIIRAKLENVIREKTAGMYSIHYDDMVVDEIGGNLTLVNLRMAYDSLRYDSLSRIGKKPSVLLKLDIPTISVTGVQTKKALDGKEFVGKKLHIIQPYIKIIYTGEGEHASRNIPTDEIYREVLGNLELIRADTVVIQDARIVTVNQQTKRDSIVLHNTDILLTDVSIDSVSNLDKSRVFFSRTLRLASEKISWSANSGKYQYGISGLAINSNSKEIRIDKIDIDPQASEVAFGQGQPYQVNRLNVHFGNIRLSGVDFPKLMEEIIVADRMETGSTSIKVYRDLRKPRDNKNRVGNYPQQQLMKIPIPFVIRQAFFPGTYVEYKELHDLTGKTGIVQFTNTSIAISNLTNDPDAIRRDNNCRVDINCRLLDLTPMKTTFIFPLGDPDGRFTVESRTGPVDAVSLNKLTEPMGMARIRKGKLNSLYFKLNGNNREASGPVTVLYEDLKIDLLEFDDDKASGIDKKDVTSFIANLFIKDDNPKKGETPRTAEVVHSRDVNRSMYNLIWKSVLEGINQTIGNKKRMKRP